MSNTFPVVMTALTLSLLSCEKSASPESLEAKEEAIRVASERALLVKKEKEIEEKKLDLLKRKQLVCKHLENIQRNSTYRGDCSLYKNTYNSISKIVLENLSLIEDENFSKRANSILISHSDAIFLINLKGNNGKDRGAMNEFIRYPLNKKDKMAMEELLSSPLKSKVAFWDSAKKVAHAAMVSACKQWGFKKDVATCSNAVRDEYIQSFKIELRTKHGLLKIYSNNKYVDYGEKISQIQQDILLLKYRIEALNDLNDLYNNVLVKSDNYLNIYKGFLSSSNNFQSLRDTTHLIFAGIIDGSDESKSVYGEERVSESIKLSCKIIWRECDDKLIALNKSIGGVN